MKKFLLSFALFFLVGCNSEEFVLAFGTSQEHFTYETNATLNVATQNADSAKRESMRTELYLRSNYSLVDFYDDGSARYEVRIDSASYSSDKRSIEELNYTERYIKTQGFQYKIAADGEILAFPSMEDFMPVAGMQDINIAKLFVKLQPVLPGKPVAVGEKWERQHAIVEGNAQTVVYKNFELADVFFRDGIRIAAIKMNVRYRQNDEDVAFKMESDDFLIGEGMIEFNIAEGAEICSGVVRIGTEIVHSRGVEHKGIAAVKLNYRENTAKRNGYSRKPHHPSAGTEIAA